MYKIAELDGVVEQPTGFEEEPVVLWVFFLSLCQCNEFRHVGQYPTALEDHASLDGCHGHVGGRQADVYRREDVCESRRTAYVPGWRKEGGDKTQRSEGEL